jgi:hypothetical protein
MRAFLVAAALMCGCANGSGGPDMAAPNSLCGHPGDKGNSLGVGQYCLVIADCTGKAALCSTLGGNTNTYFCTLTCTLGNDGGVAATNCGENATCVCGSSSGGSGCACYPNSCH